MNIHHLFLSSKRIAFFTERLPYYIFSYKHYTFHVRHYRFRIPGKFFFFFDLSDKICMYIYFTRTNRICIIHRRKNGTRPSVSRFYYVLCATFIFLNNERMRKERINSDLINFDRFGHDRIRWRPCATGKIELWLNPSLLQSHLRTCLYLLKLSYLCKKKKKKESINIFIYTPVCN